MSTYDELGIYPLEWDTQFFGFPVAQITAQLETPGGLVRALRRARTDGIRLSYLTLEEHEKSLQPVAAAEGGFLADHRLIYVADLAPVNSEAKFPDTIKEVSSDPAELESLENLALEAGIYSRFFRDPKFPREKFQLLYKTWIRRSLGRQIASTVLANIKEGRVKGMITIGEKLQSAHIGLVAVCSSERGKGLGSQLVDSASSWARQHFSKIRVVTQAENIPACRLYERCGYRVEKREQIFHFWNEV